MSAEDPRRTGLKNGLRQLSNEQLQRVLNYAGEMVLDTFNYHEGKFCPLAVAVGLPEAMQEPTDEKVRDALLAMGYKVFNTRGIVGEFYTTDRYRDLLEAAHEVIEERAQ